jgi:hypothetical protein
MIQPCLQQMWHEGPGPFNQGHGHYDNMSSTQYTMVACGFYTLSDGSGGARLQVKPSPGAGCDMPPVSS